MAIIGVRDLARTSKQILARVVDGKEPFLITRRGQPIAALVPVTAAQAESYLLASAPDLLESRRAAEQAGPDRGTLSLEAVAQELGIEDSDAAPTPAEPGDAQPAFDDPSLSLQVERIFGQATARSFLQQASDRLGRVVAQAKHRTQQSGDAGSAAASADDQALGRIAGLNEQLFRSALRDALATRLDDLVRDLATGALPDSGGPPESESDLLARALDEATAYVSSINQSIVGSDEQGPVKLPMRTLEIGLRAGIAAQSGAHHASFYGFREDTEPASDPMFGTHKIGPGAFRIIKDTSPNTGYVRVEDLTSEYLGSVTDASEPASFGKVVFHSHNFGQIINIEEGLSFKPGDFKFFEGAPKAGKRR
jgi:prevent-host-death family protein